MSTILQALGSPRRREILRLVWSGERSAGDIHRAFGDVTFGAISQHLRVLADAGLLERRDEGRGRYYRARKRELGPLRPWLQAMWSEPLTALKVRAEIEQARRGPRSRRLRRRRSSGRRSRQAHPGRRKSSLTVANVAS